MCAHTHIKCLRAHTPVHTYMMCRGTRVLENMQGHRRVHACIYIQCMHASGWQSIFFLTPATSCNTSLSGSLSPPIRICALVIRGGLRQKVEQSWHELPSGNRKGEVVLGGATAGVFAGCNLCTQQHPNDNWRERWWLNIQILRRN